MKKINARREFSLLMLVVLIGGSIMHGKGDIVISIYMSAFFILLALPTQIGKTK